MGSQIDRVKTEGMEALSDIGIERKRNEDSILYMEIELDLKDGRTTKLVVMLVCDGMGGLNAGNWASSYCCDKIEEIVKKKEYDNLNGLIRKIETAIYVINNNIIRQNRKVSTEMGRKVRAGTTFTLLLLHDNIGHLRHLGDTRLYEIIPKEFRGLKIKDGNKVNVISQDQSEVMRKVRRHEMTMEEMERSNKKNILYMCMGIFPSNKLKIFSLDFEIHPQASYLIGTDGFWHGASGQDLQDLAEGRVTLKDLIDRMKTLDGETDNISALIYRPTA